MKTTSDFLRLLLSAIALATLCAGCSTVSNLPEDEVLYKGMKSTVYTDRDSSYFTPEIEEEVEAALACAPNGALLGSSYYVNPLQTRLRIYNKYANSTSKFGKWMRNTFGKEPVLMSTVSPEMRVLVAKNLLRSNGYFNANVSYKELPMKKPKKAKLQYTVTTNEVHRYDTIEYLGFVPSVDSLLRATMSESKLHCGAPFSASNLDAERRSEEPHV